MTDAPLRVLLVEDDIDVATGLGEFLGMRGIEVDFACDATEALHVAGQAVFDLLVLDIQLPGEDGISLCRRLRRACGSEVPVLFLTAQAALDTKLRAFEAGAVDYVVKPFAPAELLARIRAIAAHTRAAGGAALAVGGWRLDRAGHVLQRGDAHLALTPLSSRMLDRLMAACPATVAREALEEALWHGTVPESDPLRAHVHQLRRQLLDRFGTAPIATVRGIGYRFEPGD